LPQRSISLFIPAIQKIQSLAKGSVLNYMPDESVLARHQSRCEPGNVRTCGGGKCSKCGSSGNDFPGKPWGMPGPSQNVFRSHAIDKQHKHLALGL
jgi:hypothetical protein